MDKKEPCFSLRDLKYAKTRYTIWQSFLELIKDKEYEEITIEEICEKSEISRGTFFNYFPSKEHLFTYFGWRFCAELYVQLNSKEHINLTSSEKIRFVFDFAVKENQLHSNQFSLYISHILRRNFDILSELKYTKADFLYEYSQQKENVSGSEELKLPTLGEVFYMLIREGVDSKEFKANIDIKKTVFYLLSIFFSPPIIYKFMRCQCTMKDVYTLLLDDALNSISNNH